VCKVRLIIRERREKERKKGKGRKTDICEKKSNFIKKKQINRKGKRKEKKD